MEKLAERIKLDFETPEEKVGAIYYWVAKNIEYDVKDFFSTKKKTPRTYRSQKELERKRYLYTKVKFKNRRGVCAGYAMIFKQLCDYCEVWCEVVSGLSYTRSWQIGKLPKESDHAWNAVKLNGEWKL